LKLFFRSNTLKKIFISEIVLIFSIFSSFLILNIIKNKKENNYQATAINKHIFKNYRTLNLFLRTEENFDLNENYESNIINPFIKDVFKIKIAESFLKKQKYSQIPFLLNNIDNKYIYISKKKFELHLKYLYSQKKHKHIIKLLNLTSINNFDIKLILIGSLIKTKNVSKAFEIFKDVFKYHKLKDFKNILPKNHLTSFIKNLDYDYLYKKFKFLAEHNQFSEIFKEKSYIKAPQLVNLFYAEYYYKKKKYSRARKRLKKIKSKRLINHRRKIEIKIDIRLNNYKDILKEIDSVKNDPEIYSELLFNSAAIFLLKNKFYLSTKLFDKYIGLQNFKNPKFWKALWLSAWINFKQNNKNISMHYFEKGTHSTIPSYRIANEYWLGELKKRKPKNLERYPFSYYFVKIFDNNKNKFETNNISLLHKLETFTNLINEKQSAIFKKIVKELKMLLKYNLIEESFDLIDWVRNEKQLNYSDKNMLSIIKSLIYLKQENFYKSFVTFKNNINCYQSIILPKFLKEIYLPIKYKTLIIKYSKINKIDPYLVLSLIREESFFRANIKSPSNAYGLMQLMPYTAKRLASKYKIKLSRGDLINPEINIRFGTEYLRILSNKYKGKLHLVLAAYNAGDYRVNKWIAEFKNPSDNIFTEMIPFSETRNYVKNILRNYFYYKYYYKGEL